MSTLNRRKKNWEKNENQTQVRRWALCGLPLPAHCSPAHLLLPEKKEEKLDSPEPGQLVLAVKMEKKLLIVVAVLSLTTRPLLLQLVVADKHHLGYY